MKEEDLSPKAQKIALGSRCHWCMDAISNHKKQPVNLTVKLLNAEHDMLSGWKITQAVL